jgi:hypothetical protein
MKRLDTLSKKTPDKYKAELHDIMGDFDTMSKSLTLGMAKKVSDLNAYLEDHPEIEVDKKTKYMLSRPSLRHIDGNKVDLGVFDSRESANKAIDEYMSKLDYGIHATSAIRSDGAGGVIATITEGFLTLEEVRDLTKALQNLENSIRTVNRVVGFTAAGFKEARTIQELGEAARRGIDESRDKGVKGGIATKAMFEMLRPETFAKLITGFDKTNPLYELMFGDRLSLKTGQRTMYDYQRRANSTYFDKFYTNKKFAESITGKKARGIDIKGTDGSGKSVTLKITPDLAMSLYMHMQNEQNLAHIVNSARSEYKAGDLVMRERKAGGMTIPDFELYKAGKIEEAYRQGTKITCDKAELSMVISELRPKEMSFIRAAQNYYSQMSQPEINAISNELNGYSIAIVDNYFRINTDADYRITNFDTIKFDGSVEGQGWTKERVDATNPINLVGIVNQLTRDIDGHSKYVGMAVPIRNLNKVLGVHENLFDTSGNVVRAYTSSLQKTIRKVWSDSANDYIAKLMADIQMPHRERSFLGGILGKLKSNYAGAVLSLNAGVAIKQAASYPTAAAELGWSCLGKAMGNWKKVSLQFIEQYSPLMRIRTEGMSTQELGDIKSLNDGNLVKKALNMKVGNVQILNWIQNMDVMTVKKLWKASEYYVKANYPSLKVGTEAFYEKVGEIHSTTIEKTQPNYTPLQRNQLLRDGNEAVKILNMFKTQPFQNFNIMFEAAAEMKAAKRALKINPNAQTKAAMATAKTRFSRAFTSQLASAFVFAMMQFAWDLFRRKDDKYKDEDGVLTIQNWGTSIMSSMTSSAFGSVMFGSLIWETIQNAVDSVAEPITGNKVFDASFYGVDAGVSLDGINDTGKTVINILGNMTNLAMDIANGHVEAEDYLRSAVSDIKTMGKVAGVPADNIQTLLASIARTIADPIMGKYTSTYVVTSTVDGITTKNKKTLITNLIRARESGAEEYDTLYNMMIQNGAFGSSTQTPQEYIDKQIDKYEKSKSEYGLNYADQEQYDTAIEHLQDTKQWSDNEEALRDITKKYAEGTSSWVTKMESAMDAGKMTDAEYILFMLACQEKNDGEWDSSPKQSIIEEVIDDMGWSDSKAKGMWDYMPTTTQNPYADKEEKAKAKAAKEAEKAAKEAEKANKPEQMTYNSSYVYGSNYDPSTQTLQLNLNGRWYTYSGVPQDVYEGLKNADSKGRYVNSYIKGRY